MTWKVVRRRAWADLVYCRDPFGIMLASTLQLPVVFEAHGVPTQPWIRRALHRALGRRQTLGLVAISEALRRDLNDVGLRGRTETVVAHDACDPPQNPVTRRSLGTPPVIGYVGNLYAGRGIETIVELARMFPTCRFEVVGGSEPDLARWRSRSLPSNLVLLGFRPQAELAALYARFDVVLMPHASSGVVGATGASDISRWTSPMKMFEYMASGVPLIASKLPVLCEVLRDGENSLLVDATRLDEWKHALQRLLNDDELRFQLARRAQDELTQHYTWDARAATVMRGLALDG
jgi:glycosyltransferase involved in cell wall biosynthesis